MKTNKQNTFDALDGSFLDTSDHTLNTQHLIDNVELTIDNTRNLYEKKLFKIIWL